MLVPWACLWLAVVGCGLAVKTPSGHGKHITGHEVPSALVAVVSSGRVGRSLAKLVLATVRPGEYLDVLWAGPRPKVVIAARSPGPEGATVPRRPQPPGADATSYQRARYLIGLTRWRAERAAARRSVRTRTRAAQAAWARALDIAGKVSSHAGPARIPRSAWPPGSLPAECAVAASALAGLDQNARHSLGSRRVILLYARSLGGVVPAGELAGDDVIVITSYLPSAAALSAAQERLLAAGAARASILGPESTLAQLTGLVSIGIREQAGTQIVSRPILFRNDSARLSARAKHILSSLVALLRRAGAIAVINGYASTPGRRMANYMLSSERANEVARYFEAHGIPRTSLETVGHGAAGPAAADRRVLVVIEQAP
jgi:outer membrane protein OmpA-like peptidoglycan-associated protein